MLEELHFDTSDIQPGEGVVENFGKGDWKLLHLNVLVYRFKNATFQGIF